MSNRGGVPTAPSIPRVVKSLGAVSFFNDIASEMVYPLLPAFLTGTLGAGAVALGALDGVSDGVSALAKLISGRIGDRKPWRRPLVIAGYLVAATVRPVMGLAGAAWQVIALRGADRIGKGVRTPPRDAVIADATDISIRGRAFGFHRAMDHAGAMTGPIIAAALIGLLSFAPREVILWSAVPGALAVGVAWWALRRELERRPGEHTSGDTPRDPSGVAAVSSSTVGLVVIFAFARFPEALFLLRLQDLGVPVAMIPLLWALLHLVRTGASYPGGVVSDRIGPARTMIIGWLIYAGVCVGLATASTPLAASCWFLGFGLVAAATESPERALVAAWGGRRWRARRFGIYHASIGLAALPGGLAFGAIYAGAGAPTALFASATLAFALTALGYGSRSRSPARRVG